MAWIHGFTYSFFDKLSLAFFGSHTFHDRKIYRGNFDGMQNHFDQIRVNALQAFKTSLRYGF